MSMQWIDRPRYQRALQIQLGLTPDQQAIVSSAAIDRAFAAEDQRRRLALMQLAAEQQKLAEILSELGRKMLEDERLLEMIEQLVKDMDDTAEMMRRNEKRGHHE